MNARARAACFVWLLAGVSSGAWSQESKTPPATNEDDEFLEFLGSVDSGAGTDANDDDWLEYLAQTDIAKVAKAKKTVTPAQTEKSKPAPEKSQDTK